MKASKEPPHQLIVRVNAAPGASRDTMREVMAQHVRAFAAQGFSSHMRTYVNSDDSVDGEIRIDVSTGERSFREAVLTLGDIAHIPGSI